MDSELTIIHVESIIVHQPVNIVYSYLADRFTEQPDWYTSCVRIEGPASYHLKAGAAFEGTFRFPFSIGETHLELNILEVSRNQRLTYEAVSGSFLPVWDFFTEEVSLERTRLTHVVMSKQDTPFFNRIRLPLLQTSFSKHIPKILLQFRRRMEKLEVENQILI